MRKDSAVNRQYKEMNSLRRSLPSIYSLIGSLSLAIKPWLFLALLMRAVEVVLKGSEVLEIWIYVPPTLSLQVTYVHALCLHICPDIAESASATGEAEQLIPGNYCLALLCQKGQVAPNP